MDCPSSQRDFVEADWKPNGLSRCREIEVEKELKEEKRLRDVNKRQMEELKEKERDLEKLRQERMKRELEKEEEINAIKKRERELKEREERLEEAARKIKRIDALFSGTDNKASKSREVFRRSRSRSKIRLGSRSRSGSRRKNYVSRGARQGEKSNSRGKSATVRMTKGRLDLKDRVRVRNDLLTDVAKVRQSNRDEAQSRQQIRQQGVPTNPLFDFLRCESFF